jgi:hypothetical protein
MRRFGVGVKDRVLSLIHYTETLKKSRIRIRVRAKLRVTVWC